MSVNGEEPGVPLLTLDGGEEEVISIDLTLTDSRDSIQDSKTCDLWSQQCYRDPNSQPIVLHSPSPACLVAKRHEKTGLYTDGNYAATEMQIHVNPTSIPALDTPNNGVLHIITGWRAGELLSDLCYKYNTKGRWTAKGTGFLKTQVEMKKKVYECSGVMACPLLVKHMERFEHSTSEEWCDFKNSLTDPGTKAEILEMKKARNLYVALTNPDIHFCPAILSSDSTHLTRMGNRCNGTPTIRQVQATKEYFIGCSHYFIHKDTKSKHYFLSLRSYTPTAIKLLDSMFKENQPVVIPGDICEFVAVKKGRAMKRCATHGELLVEAGTINSVMGPCQAKMLLMEPVGQDTIAETHEPTQVVTYAMCWGVHNHAPPPQPDSTERKKVMFRNFAEDSPGTTPALLKLRTQEALQSTTNQPMQSLRLSKNCMYNTLRDVRKQNEKNEFTSMFEMAGRNDEPYVRDARIVRGGVVFLLATDEMLALGLDRFLFAGDATFKTVMERNPHYETPDWYLYNIVAPHDPTTPKQRGVVVCRALMTTLTAEAYSAVWGMFLKGMKEEKGRRMGISVGDVSIEVPYMSMEPERKHNAISVRAVTTDFEVAEVEGIATAFAEMRGGSADTHISHLLVGCRVHFERAVLKRAASMQPKDSAGFKEACRKLQCAASIEEGDEYYAKIHGLDNTWGAWLSRSHVRPLVSPAYSRMRKSDRMIALETTNIVESQNRLGNLICGTHVHPVVCTARLKELDTISARLVSHIEPNSGQQVPRQRTRNGHTLQPGDTQPRRGGTRNNRGRKRKVPSGNPPTSTGKRRLNGNMVIGETGDGTQSLDSADRYVIPSESSQSLKWLHDELGARCQQASGEGNERLLLALTKLYSYVLQCNDVNKVKFRILSTLQQESGDKLIIHAFTQLLVLTSKEGNAQEQKHSGSGTHTKEESVLVDEKGETPKSQNEITDEIDVIQID